MNSPSPGEAFDGKKFEASGRIRHVTTGRHRLPLNQEACECRQRYYRIFRAVGPVNFLFGLKRTGKGGL